MRIPAKDRLASDLTLLQLWRGRVDRSRMSPTKIHDIDTALEAWDTYTGSPLLMAITPSTIARFREGATKAGLAATTIETYWGRVLSIARRFRPLLCPRRNKHTESAKALTVREAFIAYYAPASPGLRPNTHKHVKHVLNSWERHTGNPTVGEIKTAHFDEWRTNALAAGLSNASVETCVTMVLSILRQLERIELLPKIPWAGKRLKRRPKLKPTPTLEDLSAVYQHVHVVSWPAKRPVPVAKKRGRFQRGVAVKNAIVWWRGFLALAYFTALRRNDLLTLRWREIEAGFITRTMEKTAADVKIPIHPVLQMHLDELRRIRGGTEYVLGHGASYKQVLRELKAMAEAAGIRPFTPQGLRRLSSQQFDKARPGAGGLILGHIYRSVDAFYLSTVEPLVEALPHLAVPEAMKPKGAIAEPTPAVTNTNGHDGKTDGDGNAAVLEALRGLGKAELSKLLLHALVGDEK